MEAQRIISIFCPKSSLTPSIPMVKQPFSLNFAPLDSLSSYPFLRSQTFGFPTEALHATSFVHKEVYSSSWRILGSKSSSTVELEEDRGVRARVTVRRKKLAVFVSGGGSNFRSIHEASKRGSLHGDVTVLVTDKSGNSLS